MPHFPSALESALDGAVSDVVPSIALDQLAFTVRIMSAAGTGLLGLTP